MFRIAEKLLKTVEATGTTQKKFAKFLGEGENLFTSVKAPEICAAGGENTLVYSTNVVKNSSRFVYTNIAHISQNTNKMFQEAIEALIARNPLKNGESEKIQRLINKILSNKDYSDEADLFKYLKNIRNLASKRSMNGQILLNSNDVFALADFKNRNLQIPMQDIKDLIWATERGHVRFNTLSQVQPGNESLLQTAKAINSDLLSDIKKLRYAQENGINPIDVFIPEFTSFPRNAKEIKKLKPGDLFSLKVGNSGNPETYIVTSETGGLSPLFVDRQTLFDLMPPIKRFYVQQAHSGTCYELASYISQMHSPKHFASILQRIKSENGQLIIRMPIGSSKRFGQPNIFAGKFSDFTSQNSVQTVLENGRYNALDKSQSVKSNPVIKALETLYGAHRKYIAADDYIFQLKYLGKDVSSEYNYLLKNMNSTIIENGKRYTLKEFYDYQVELFRNGQLKHRPKMYQTADDYYKESGIADELFDFMADRRQHHLMVTNGNNSVQTLNDMRTSLIQPNVVCGFGTLPKGLTRESAIIPEKSLYSSHAYSIIGYNQATDNVQYINPWNSAFIFEMPLKDLASKINHIDFSRRI